MCKYCGKVLDASFCLFFVRRIKFIWEDNIKINVQKLGRGGMAWIAVAYGREINAA
jgi:hypothetical protein